MTDARDVHGRPIINGDVCDISVQSEKGAGAIRLMKTDHWRFHDFYVTKSEGKDVSMWLSYAKDHPIETAWRMMWN